MKWYMSTLPCGHCGSESSGMRSVSEAASALLMKRCSLGAGGCSRLGGDFFIFGIYGIELGDMRYAMKGRKKRKKMLQLELTRIDSNRLFRYSDYTKLIVKVLNVP